MEELKQHIIPRLRNNWINRMHYLKDKYQIKIPINPSSLVFENVNTSSSLN